MIRDKAWLTNEIEIMGSETSENYPHEQMVDREVVLNLIDQLEEPEKVIIPKFAAEWIEKAKETEYPLAYAINQTSGELGKWLHTHVQNVDIRKNQELFAKAWVNGYEVEKEKLYYVRLPNANSERKYLYLTQGNSTGNCWFNSRLERLDYESGVCKHQFTEKEIKSIDPRYWQFAEPVEASDDI